MNEVFVSYKRDDERRAGRLVHALQAHALSVWWDRGLPGGQAWRAGIESALAEARCVIVLWSRASVGAEAGFVHDEAARAARRRILLPVLLDPVQPPLGFGELQAIDLSAWRGAARDPFLLDLVAAARALLDGRPPPVPQGPRRRLQRRITLGGLGLAAAAAGLAFALNLLGVQQAACALPLAQPALSDACGAAGLGARPTRAERLAWAQRPAGDCAALREHLQAFPDGAYRTTAAAWLDARRVTPLTRWVPARRPLRLYVGREAAPLAGLAAARADALARGQRRADTLCRELAAAAGARHRAADPEVQDWLCDTLPGGRQVCGFDGRALCTLDEAQLGEQEVCGGDALQQARR